METKTILEKAQNVAILAAEYGETKDTIRVCAMQCKADTDNYLYKRSTVLFENLDDSILKVSDIIKGSDVLIFDDEFTGNMLRRYFDFDHKRWTIFYDIAAALLPASKMSLLNGSRAATDIYHLLYNTQSDCNATSLFDIVDRTRKGINAIYRYQMLRKSVLSLKNKQSDYIDHICNLLKDGESNMAVLNYSNLKGFRTLSGVKPASPTFEQFLATDCTNNKSSRDTVIEFFAGVDTLVIFDENETELIHYLREVLSAPFKFNVVNIYTVAREMFITAPKNKVDLLNYYLLAFEILYGDYFDAFERLSEYYSVLQLMLSDYKNTQNCYDRK